MHRKDLPDADTLNLIFSFQENRKLSKNLEMSYGNMTYQVKTAGIGYGLRHATITVCEDLSGNVSLIYKGRALSYKCHKKQKCAPDIIHAKQLERKLDQVKKYIPGPNHPWRRYATMINAGKEQMQNVAQLSTGT